MAHEPKLEFIESIQRLSFRTTPTFGTSVLSGQMSLPIPPLSSVELLEMDIKHGLNEPPTSTIGYELYLLFTDFAQLPDIAAARSRAIWSDAKRWYAVGTPAVIVQTITKEIIDWFNPEVKSNLDIRSRARNQGYVIIGIADQSSTDVLLLGVITYRITYVQRTWGDDNHTWSTADETHNDETWEEYAVEDDG